MVPDAMMRVTESDVYRTFRELMQRGIDLVEGEDEPGAARLTQTRDFYAFIERELPRLVERFKREQQAREVGDDD